MIEQTTARIAFALFMVASIAFFGRTVGLGSPWFGLVSSFSVLGLFDLAMPVARIRMPTALQSVRSWETSRGAYRMLGVVAFGAFLRETPLRLLNRRVYLTSFPGDLQSVRTQLENAEAAHFWGGLATLPYLALAALRGWWINFALVILFDIVVNVFPILHLRMIRGRLERASKGKRSLARGNG